jgi:rSAM/selenodomain-associated transferase 2
MLMKMPQISVIIPAWNEAQQIEPLLRYLLATGYCAEIIVADGQSDDDTVAVVERFAAHQNTPIVPIVSIKRGRGAQMNAGAREAKGDTLFFLHADTLPPAGWHHVIAETIARPNTAAGFFSYSLNTASVGLKIIELGVAIRSGVFNLPYGDQGLFLSKKIFESVGGFAEIPLMEDIEILQRLRPHGKLREASLSVVTSARRFQKYGTLKTFTKDALISAAFHAKVSPHLLARFYHFGNRERS